MKWAKIFFTLFLVFFAGLFFLRSRPQKLSEGILNSAKTEISTVKISEDAVSLQEAFIQVSDAVKPAVVNISAVYLERVTAPQYEFFFGSPFEDFFEEFFGMPSVPRKKAKPQMRRYEGTGSGFIIDATGHIITNEHVIRGAEEIQVTVYSPDGSQKKYKGEVIGKDPRTDLAVIKISIGRKLPYVRMGDSNNLRVGQWVIAVGSPFGLEQTVTTGIVSAKRQAISIEGKTYRDLIQTDAAINRGNSGGPLCNLRGEVVGINTAIYAPTGVFAGVGFAVPINRAKAVIDELIKTGKVTRSWLGVEIRPVDVAIQKNFNLPNAAGAFVSNVLEDSPADKAGLKRGDVIVEFDGKKIDTPVSLQDIVAATPPNKKVAVKLFRDSREQNFFLTVSKMPEDVKISNRTEERESPPPKFHEWLGVKVANLTDEMRSEYGISTLDDGVVVIDIEYGSKASDIGLSEGDLIKVVNNQKISSIDDFKKISEKINLKKGVVLDIIRAGRPMFLTYYEE